MLFVIRRMILVAILAMITVDAIKLKQRILIPDDIDILSKRGIEYLNNLNTTWKARRNFPSRTPKSYFKKIMGTWIRSKEKILPEKIFSPKAFQNLPVQFDARKKWPQCRTIKVIRDQADCGSCWAFAAAEVLSDRICIHGGSGPTSTPAPTPAPTPTPTQSPYSYPHIRVSDLDYYDYDYDDDYANRTSYVMISPIDIVSCCNFCGDKCDGGIPSAAWKYMKEQGVVTGGDYGNTEFCLPYPFSPCGHLAERPCKNEKAPPCKKKCIPQYPISYQSDRYFVSKAYSIDHDEKSIMQEIYTNGPVEAAMIVYEDFLDYYLGVYQAHSLNELGGHAIKILGWGVENGVPYWLCANSWTTQWGDEGFFKIRRGIDECGIESSITAGLPA